MPFSMHAERVKLRRPFCWQFVKTPGECGCAEAINILRKHRMSENATLLAYTKAFEAEGRCIAFRTHYTAEEIKKGVTGPPIPTGWPGQEPPVNHDQKAPTFEDAQRLAGLREYKVDEKKMKATFERLRQVIAAIEEAQDRERSEFATRRLNGEPVVRKDDVGLELITTYLSETHGMKFDRVHFQKFLNEHMREKAPDMLFGYDGETSSEGEKEPAQQAPANPDEEGIPLFELFDREAIEGLVDPVVLAELERFRFNNREEIEELVREFRKGLQEHAM